MHKILMDSESVKALMLSRSGGHTTMKSINSINVRIGEA